MRRPTTIALACALAALALVGCRGDRILRIHSTPPGATVRLDDTVVGRTPVDIPFKDYGRRRLALYRPGYQTHTQALKVDARWWSHFPIDIITEIIIPMGLDDIRELNIPLIPDTGEEAAPAAEEFYDHALRARAGEVLPADPPAETPGEDNDGE